MPNISNVTVATGTGLSTAGNGGRKLVRLTNGWIVAVVHDTAGFYYSFQVLKPGETQYQPLCKLDHYNGVNPARKVVDISLTSVGNRVHVVATLDKPYSGNPQVTHYSFDATSVVPTDNLISGYKSLNRNIDSLENVTGNVSLVINEAGTELHAAWSSKNSTYPNSFNIRYAKGTTNPDGSVTWGAVEQVTKMSNGIYEARNPSVVIDVDGVVSIFYEAFGHRYNTGGANTTSTGSSHNSIAVLKRNNSLPSKDTTFINSPTWSAQNVHTGNSHQQASPSSLFVPTAINGLANGRLWVAWQGRDSTDNVRYNVRVSYSDDGGVTWATPVKLTSGNVHDQMNPSITADNTGKVFLVWDSNANTIQTAQNVFNDGTWGATTTLTGNGYTNVSALFDNRFSLVMTSPPLVRQSPSGVYFSGNYFTGASVSPSSGALGNKETPAITAYTVTPEAGSTVTQIVEKVNGVTVNTFNNPASLSRTFTIPTATWDALAYYTPSTASVTVTDSNGAQTVTTYSFDRRLATGASLLEATKATGDAKNRISQKRDALAAQVGLSAGSTFDAISAQLASGNAFKKFASGIQSWSTDSSYSQTSYVITGLAFTPSFIVVIRDTPKTSSSYFGTGVFTGSDFIGMTSYGTASISGQAGVYNIVPSTNSFTVFMVGASSAQSGTFTWYAFG